MIKPLLTKADTAKYVPNGETNFLWVNCRSHLTSTFLISMKICRTLMSAMIVRRNNFIYFSLFPMLTWCEFLVYWFW